MGCFEFFGWVCGLKGEKSNLRIIAMIASIWVGVPMWFWMRCLARALLLIRFF